MKERKKEIERKIVCSSKQKGRLGKVELQISKRVIQLKRFTSTSNFTAITKGALKYERNKIYRNRDFHIKHSNDLSKLWMRQSGMSKSTTYVD